VGARYVWRIDDVTPGMERARFQAFIDLFRRRGVVPLLGVVPENRDPDLCREPDDPRFWQTLRNLGEGGAVEFAQHGHQHLSVTRRVAPSEFAGLSYAQQVEKIARGQETLRREGIPTDVWMAPYHSFDEATLEAIRSRGFRFVSDGAALYPFEQRGLVFVPQQLWRPRRFPFGVFTVCLHTNRPDNGLYRSVEQFLESGARSIRFTEAAAAVAGGVRERAVNLAFAQAWRLLRRLKRPTSTRLAC
jgi:predicted deacetylase